MAHPGMGASELVPPSHLPNPPMVFHHPDWRTGTMHLCFDVSCQAHGDGVLAGAYFDSVLQVRGDCFDCCLPGTDIHGRNVQIHGSYSTYFDLDQES